MKTILFALELGAGWGHVGLIEPFVRHFVQEGHKVTIATSQLQAVERIIGGSQATLISAPAQTVPPVRTPCARSFTEVLANTCFGEAGHLAARCAAWQAIFQFAKPDVIIGEHAPTALLAARTTDAKVMACGTAFTLPASTNQWIDLRPELNTPPSVLEEIEDRVLGRLNNWLKIAGGRLLKNISCLYHDTELQLLTTVQALDWHATQRNSELYAGISPTSGGEVPRWPDGKGGRVLAYLKPFPGLEATLHELQQSTMSCLIVCPGIDARLKQTYTSRYMAIVESPLDLIQATRECDIAIGHGSHSFTALALLSGKPQLMLPLHLEQHLNAAQVCRLNAGYTANYRNSRDVSLSLRQLKKGECRYDPPLTSPSSLRRNVSQASLSKMLFN